MCDCQITIIFLYVIISVLFYFISLWLHANICHELVRETQHVGCFAIQTSDRKFTKSTDFSRKFEEKKRILCNWMQRFIIVGAVIAIAIVKIVWIKPTNEENKIKDRQTNRQTDIKDRRFLDTYASSADFSAQLRLTSYAVVCKITRII